LGNSRLGIKNLTPTSSTNIEIFSTSVDFRCCDWNYTSFFYSIDFTDLADSRPMDFNFAYLAGGQLHLKLGQTQTQTVVSEFGLAAQQRVRQMQKRHSWKQQSTASFLPAGFARDGEMNGTGLAVTIKGICQTPSNRLLYALEAGEVGGIFTIELPQQDLGDRRNGYEKRLFHSADFKVQQLDFNAHSEEIACAVVRKDGSAHIATMSATGTRLTEVTEGDSIDLAPKWLGGNRQAIVFQSTGVGRNSAGYIVEHRHTTIEQLDFDRHEVITLASDPQYDLLAPQVTDRGTLYCIRRPYQPLRRRIGLRRTLSDLSLIPFRLLMAVFEWLNFFTRRYTGKSLLNLERQPQSDLRHAVLLGRWVDVRAEMERNRRHGDADAPGIVPQTWQLIRQQPHQLPEIVARGVLSFDVAPDGSIVYSNGSAVYGVTPNGQTQRLNLDRSSDDLTIEQVVFLDRTNNYDLN
jgi:hypothetical protein